MRKRRKYFIKYSCVSLIILPIFLTVFCGCDDPMMYDMASLGYSGMANNPSYSLQQRQAAAAASTLYANQATREHELNVAQAGNPNGNYQRNAGECFIATAAYGKSWDKNVLKLQSFRDKYLLTNDLGRWFESSYYHHSPRIADAIRNRPWAKLLTRLALTPITIVAGASTGNNRDIALLSILSLGGILIIVKIIKKLKINEKCQIKKL